MAESMIHVGKKHQGSTFPSSEAVSVSEDDLDSTERGSLLNLKMGIKSLPQVKLQ